MKDCGPDNQCNVMDCCCDSNDDCKQSTNHPEKITFCGGSAGLWGKQHRDKKAKYNFYICYVDQQ